MAFIEQNGLVLGNEAGKISVKLENGQTVSFEAKNSAVPAGSAIRLRLLDPETEAGERSALAAAVLNELIQAEPISP